DAEVIQFGAIVGQECGPAASAFDGEAGRALPARGLAGRDSSGVLRHVRLDDQGLRVDSPPGAEYRQRPFPPSGSGKRGAGLRKAENLGLISQSATIIAKTFQKIRLPRAGAGDETPLFPHRHLVRAVRVLALPGWLVLLLGLGLAAPALAQGTPSGQNP